jgi:uncharacterized membrane protein YqjE
VSTGDDGLKPGGTADKSVGEIVSEVTEKASLLVRQEIDLAKAEVQEKVSKLAKGAGVGAAAGVFLLFMFVFLLHTLAYFTYDLFDFSQVWMGYGVVTLLLLVLALIAGLLAFRWLKGGAPPTPDLAIEEAKRTREQLDWQKVERDQVGRTLERGEELES